MASSREVLQAMSDSKPIEVFITVIIHSVYAAVIAVCLIPTFWIAIELLPRIVTPLVSGETAVASWMGVRYLFLGAGTVSLMFYAYLFVGCIVQATLIRLLSLGVKPGRYPAVSMTTLRWLIYNGIFTISVRTILPIIPVTFLIELHFRIQGCKIGKKVRINSCFINDSFLLTMDDNVIVGGEANVSCHLFEGDHLILQPVRIGENSLIGSHAYISPGVTIGKDCTIGLNAYIRRGKVIPDNTTVTSVASVNIKTARRIERGLE